MNHIISSLTRKLKISFSLIALITLLWLLYNLSQVLINTNDTDSSAINDYISNNFSYLKDENSSLSIDSILGLTAAFRQEEPNSIPFELGDETYWIKIELENNTSFNTKSVLHVDNSMMAIFNFFVFEEIESGQFLQNQQKSSSERIDILAEIFPHIPITLSPYSKQNIYLQIKLQGPPNVGLNLYSTKQFEKHVILSVILYGAFISVILLMGLYNLCIFASIKDKVYLFYVGYLISALLILASTNGFGYLLLSQNTLNWLNNHSLFFHYTLIISLVLFTVYFLRYEERKSKRYYVGMLTVIILITTSIISTFLPHENQVNVFFTLQPLCYLIALFLVLGRLKKDYFWARFYFVSWLPLLAGAAIQPLLLLNYIEYSFIHRNAFVIGVLVEVSFMALALAERMRRHENDRLFELSYHSPSGLPRRSNLENSIKLYSNDRNTSLSVVIIKPENIDTIKPYMDDEAINKLFVRLHKQLSRLANHNNAVLPLTSKDEKIVFIHDSCLGLLVDNQKCDQSFDRFFDSIQQLVSENYYVGEFKLPLSAQIGVADYSERTPYGTSLVEQAYMASEKACNSANKWAMHNEYSSSNSEDFLVVGLDITYALKNDVFEIYHQPQIDLKTLRVCGSECLIRWPQEDGNFISPRVFIPIAEKLGLINDISYWVIQKALEQHALICENEKYNHMISINISGKDIVADNFFIRVTDIIESSGISADKIIFELTESANFENNERAIDIIHKLSELGITVSIDDFGTGYSTMSHLDILPFGELKVDRQFVEGIMQDTKRQVISKSTVQMAKGLGLEVVAEGINSESDQNTLRQYGCDIGQGYYYSKPLPLTDYLQWLDAQVNGKAPDNFYGEFIPAEKS